MNDAQLLIIAEEARRQWDNEATTATDVTQPTNAGKTAVFTPDQIKAVLSSLQPETSGETVQVPENTGEKRGRGRPAFTDPTDPKQFRAIAKRCKEIQVYSALGWVKVSRKEILKQFKELEPDGPIPAEVVGDTLFVG
jgi:hypothetical protein